MMNEQEIQRERVLDRLTNLSAALVLSPLRSRTLLNLPNPTGILKLAQEALREAFDKVADFGFQTEEEIIAQVSKSLLDTGTDASLEARRALGGAWERIHGEA